MKGNVPFVFAGIRDIELDLQQPTTGTELKDGK